MFKYYNFDGFFLLKSFGVINFKNLSKIKVEITIEDFFFLNRELLNFKHDVTDSRTFIANLTIEEYDNSNSLLSITTYMKKNYSDLIPLKNDFNLQSENNYLKIILTDLTGVEYFQFFNNK